MLQVIILPVMLTVLRSSYTFGLSSSCNIVAVNWFYKFISFSGYITIITVENIASRGSGTMVTDHLL